MSAMFQNTITVLRYVATYLVLISVSVLKVFKYAETENHAKVSIIAMLKLFGSIELVYVLLGFFVHAL